MKTIFFSIPSGSHKRAYFQPLYPLIKNNSNLNIIGLTPAAKYPRLLSEFQSSNIKFIEFKHDIWSKYKPDLVTASTTGLDARDVIILQEAKKNKIPTLVYVESWDNVWKMVRHKKNMVKVDRILVWNQTMKNQLEAELGYQEKEIALVGSPRLDPLVLKKNLPSKEELFSELGLDANKPLLHLATVELYDTAYLAKIISKARNLGKIPKNLQIYASVHPGGDINNHKWYAEKYGLNKIAYSFGRHESPIKEFLYNPTQIEMLKLYAMFKHADVLVNLSSTVALESMLADTPVINVKFGKRFDLKWYRSPVYTDFKEHYKQITEHKGTWVAKSRRELLKAINTYLKTPWLHSDERKTTAQKVVTFLDGKCTNRLYKEILNFLDN